MSLYREAINALKQILLLDERVRTTALDVARLSEELADLRDRVSRLEGMLSSRDLPQTAGAHPRKLRRLAAPKGDEG